MQRDHEKKEIKTKTNMSIFMHPINDENGRTEKLSRFISIHVRDVKRGRMLPTWRIGPMQTAQRHNVSILSHLQRLMI